MKPGPRRLCFLGGGGCSCGGRDDEAQREDEGLEHGRASSSAIRRCRCCSRERFYRRSARNTRGAFLYSWPCKVRFLIWAITQVRPQIGRLYVAQALRASPLVFSLSVIEHLRLNFGLVVQNYTVHARAAERLAPVALK